MITNLKQQFWTALNKTDDEESSLSNGSLSDVQEEGSAMNFLEMKKTLTKSDSNSMSVKSKNEVTTEPKVPMLIFPKKKNSSPIKDDLAMQANES